MTSQIINELLGFGLQFAQVRIGKDDRVGKVVFFDANARITVNASSIELENRSGADGILNLAEIETLVFKITIFWHKGC